MCVQASYYIHHASVYYYGEFDAEGVFHRNEGAASLYRRIQQSGGEIGLHADPLAVFRRGVDGFEALRTELAWLRDQGLNIRGSTAHGSAPTYGAENFEVFRGRKFFAGETVSLAGEENPPGLRLGGRVGAGVRRKLSQPGAERPAGGLALRYLATTAEVDPQGTCGSICTKIHTSAGDRTTRRGSWAATPGSWRRPIRRGCLNTASAWRTCLP